MELDPDGPPEKEKLVLKRYVLGWGRLLVRNQVRLFKQTKRAVRYRGRKKVSFSFVYNTIKSFIFFRNDV